MTCDGDNPFKMNGKGCNNTHVDVPCFFFSGRHFIKHYPDHNGEEQPR
jgi:hypothetical protein